MFSGIITTTRPVAMCSRGGSRPFPSSQRQKAAQQMGGISVREQGSLPTPAIHIAPNSHPPLLTESSQARSLGRFFNSNLRIKVLVA